MQVVVMVPVQVMVMVPYTGVGNGGDASHFNGAVLYAS